MEPSPGGVMGGQVRQIASAVPSGIPNSAPTNLPNQLAAHTLPTAQMAPSVIVASSTAPVPMPMPPSLSRRRRRSASSDDSGDDGASQAKKAKKHISPFDPAAIVPLPHQLDEMGSTGTTVWKRNERERYRVRCVNEGYEQLRARLPYGGERRLSKVDTLRLAVDYIKHMGQLLENPLHDRECQCFVKTLTSANDGSSGE